MKVSIITTVYKAEKDLPRLLDSMMAQKSLELEFFLIVNGSPDRCGEICQEYAMRDSRFKVFTLKENIGYIRARNLGIQEVDADYIGFCDSDDYLEPGGYDRAIEKIKKTNCDLYLTAYRTIIGEAEEKSCLPYKEGLYQGDDVHDIIRPQAFGRLPGRGVLHGFAWKQIVRRKVVKENGFYFMEELKPYEDQLFNTDIIGKCETVYVDDSIIYNYIVNQASITVQLFTRFNPEEEKERILLLYTEKKKRSIDEIEKKANCNESLEMIYECILAMVKKRTNVYGVSRRVREHFSGDIVKEILNGSSVKLSFVCRFTRFCLRLHLFTMLIICIRTMIALRGKA